MKYDCSQCIHFRTGRSDACIFAGRGAISPSPLVNLTDDEGNPIVGRLTRPTNNCKTTWGLESNEYWEASDDIANAVKSILEK